MSVMFTHCHCLARLHPTPDEQIAKDINPAWGMEFTPPSYKIVLMSPFVVTTALFSNCADSQTRLPNPSCPCQLRDLLPHLIY